MSILTSIRARKAALALVGATAAGALLTGCSQGIENGALPSTPEITDQTGRIITLWNGSWIAALIVGVITWVLILWSVAVYRRRKDDDKLPVQTRVHLPLELMYTVVPLMMIAVLFKYTAEDISAITEPTAEPDIHIQVIGKQWSWDFNYLDEDVHELGVQVEIDADGAAVNEFPKLYLPVDETVEFTLDSRDVIHSFYIPAFLYKEDTVPGRTNTWQVTPTEVGTYIGRCAELCGEYHAYMMFDVEVVERAEYDAYIQSLRDKGQTGIVGLEYNRDQAVQIAVEEEGE